MKTLFLSTAFAALALGANAQTNISFGVEGGININSLRSTVAGEKATTASNIGPRAGVFANIGFGEQLGVQVGLMYSQKGGKNESNRTVSTGNSTNGANIAYLTTGETTLSYIELPVNVVYHFNNEQSGFFLMAGAYGALALNGKAKGGSVTTTTTTTVNGVAGAPVTTSSHLHPAQDQCLTRLQVWEDVRKDQEALITVADTNNDKLGPIGTTDKCVLALYLGCTSTPGLLL